MDAQKRQVVWRFSDLDLERVPAGRALEADDFVRMHEALASYETQTCSEIWGQHDNGCKRYDLESAHANITSRMAERSLDDETAVHTLRASSTFRIYGVLRENIFYLLWLDRDHEMWPSPKKHT